MKKVCIVRQGFFPGDVRVRKEALALAEKGYKVDVICLLDDNQEKREVYRGINVYRIPINHIRGGFFRYLYEYASFFFVAGLKLCSLFFRNRYDFIQVNTLPDFLVFITAIPRLFGAKVILDLHEPSPELLGTIFGFDKNLLLNMTTIIEQLSIRFADKAITVSEQMKLNYIDRGANPEKFSVVLNVPHPEFNVDSNVGSHKGNYQRTENKKLSLICHGTIIERYGQHIAVKAMSHLKDATFSIQLIILGRGEYAPELRKLISDLKLEDYVHFPGFILFDDMIKTIAESDIGIVPVEKNLYSDLVHTNKMFEYIAMRKPVIITRTKAVEDFFGPDNSCLKYFESGDEKDLARCILELYNSPETRERMVRNAYTKFESVRWEITKEDYCKLFG